MNMDVLDRFKYLILTVFLILIAAGAWFSRGLDLDPSLESRFLKDNPHLDAYKEFGGTFGGEPLLLVVWRAEGDVWEARNLSRLRELTDEIEKIPGVESVVSIATLPGLNGADSKGTDIETLKRLPLVKKILVDNESRRGVLFIVPEKGAASPSAGLALVKSLEGAVGKDGFVTGPLAMQSKAIEFSRRDLTRMLLVVACCVVLLFGVAYRSWQAVAAAVFVTVFALCAVCGVLALAGIRLSQFALIALPILAVAGLEDVVFLLRHYVAAIGKNAGRMDACRQMFASSGVPCFWTTATTMAGFASLLASDIEQIRSIGIVLVVGGPLALAASVTIVPAFLLAWPMKARREMQSGDSKAKAFVSFASRHRRLLTACFVVATLVAGYGIRYTKMRFDFPKIFRPGVEFQKELSEIDDKLAGGASFEIILEANDGGDFTEYSKLNQIVGLQTALALTGPVATTISPIDIGITAYLIRNGIPENPRVLLKNAGELVKEMGGGEKSPLSAWLTTDLKKARIHVRVRTDREKYYDQLLATLAYLRDGFKRKGVDVTWSGFSLLYKEMERRMVKALIWSSLIAFVCVLAMLMIFLRSVKWGTIAMIPNVLPIICVVGVIGWVGTGFSLGLVILPAVGIGLIADDTIHFIWGVRRYLKEGDDLKESITKVLSTSGTAMILSTTILIAGFASLAVSPFVSNAELALFMPLLLLLSLVFDLVGVPVMLFLFNKRL